MLEYWRRGPVHKAGIIIGGFVVFLIGVTLFAPAPVECLTVDQNVLSELDLGTASAVQVEDDAWVIANRDGAAWITYDPPDAVTSRVLLPLNLAARAHSTIGELVSDGSPMFREYDATTTAIDDAVGCDA